MHHLAIAIKRELERALELRDATIAELATENDECVREYLMGKIDGLKWAITSMTSLLKEAALTND